MARVYGVCVGSKRGTFDTASVQEASVARVYGICAGGKRGTCDTASLQDASDEVVTERSKKSSLAMRDSLDVGLNYPWTR